MASRAETGDAEETQAAEEALPHGALAQAQELERARVTLFRAIRTTARMLEVRGFEITMVGPVSVESGDRAAQAAAMAVYGSAERATTAERSREIVLEAAVPAVPERFTTAWADGTPPGSRVIVIVIDQGNVETIREVVEEMATMGARGAVLLSRKDLTSFSKKFLLETPACARIQHFQFVDLQAAICDHSLVPRHVPLDAVASARLRKRYVGGPFPRLLPRDPMVRFLGLGVGALVAVREAFGREQATLTYLEVSDAN